MSPHPLILFSGLGADAEVFAPQKAAFPHLTVPEWIVPEPSETLSEYCERFARKVQPTSRPILGGASFGGVVALEMARFLNPLAIVLIGSVRDSRHVPRRIRAMRHVVPQLPLRLLQWFAGSLAWPPIRKRIPHLGGLARQFRDADPAIVSWSLRQIVRWDRMPEVACPVYQIHGDRDFVFPIVRDATVTTIPGGGHVISLTHAAEVNAFLGGIVDATENKSAHSH